MNRYRNGSWIRSTAQALCLLVFAGGAEAADMAGRSTVYSGNGLIATSQPLATAAGLRILQDGGNAVDAAVAAAAVLAVTEPMMTGIGGDMFAILWLADEQRLVGINGSGRSGTDMTPESLRAAGHEEVPRTGALSVTVPGALAGWNDLLKRHGTLELADVLAPAIRIADEGFPVAPEMAILWERSSDLLRADEGARQVFLVDGQRAPAEGERFRNPDLAASFREIAKDGPGAFYGGALGRKIVAHVRSQGGFLRVEDLASHRSEWVTPMSIEYRDVSLYELPPNGQGIAALEMLRILEPFDLAGMGHNSPDYLHHLIEAKKIAYADLEYFVGDPAAMTVSAEALLSDPFIDSRRALLDPQKANARPEPGKAMTESDTTYLSVADSDGNMVSFINSVAGLFGSGVVVPGTGFVLQNRGSGFTTDTGLANTVGPGKRPFHTIIPAFATRRDDAGKQRPWISFGVMGGSMQPQGHVQVLINLVDFGMGLQEAVDAARFRHLRDNRVALEPAIPESTARALTALGHDVERPPNMFYGGAQIVERIDAGWAGASEPRLDGMAAGY